MARRSTKAAAAPATIAPRVVTIGKLADGGGPATLDIDVLLTTRLGIQAISRAGKSATIRTICEQSFGLVQHIILDGEGEFYTLREKHPYVLAGDDGDFPVTVENAEALALALLEHGLSAVVNLHPLRMGARRIFIARFIEAMIAAPQRLWHPVLVVIDEAQKYAPEGAKVESSEAIVDLMDQGGKRGFACILATQRLARLHKDASGGLANWLLGLVVQDVDRRRACSYLGFTPGSAEGRSLADLAAGTFYGVGPAITQKPALIRIARPETTHVKSGEASAPTPPAPAAMKELFAALRAAAGPVDEERGRLDTDRDWRPGATSPAPAAPRAAPDEIAAAVRKGTETGMVIGDQQGYERGRREAEDVAAVTFLRLHQQSLELAQAAQALAAEAGAWLRGHGWMEAPTAPVGGPAPAPALPGPASRAPGPTAPVGGPAPAPALPRPASRAPGATAPVAAPAAPNGADGPAPAPRAPKGRGGRSRMGMAPMPGTATITDRLLATLTRPRTWAEAAAIAGVTPETPRVRQAQKKLRESGKVRDVGGVVTAIDPPAAAIDDSPAAVRATWMARLGEVPGEILAALADRSDGLPVDKSTVAEWAGQKAGTPRFREGLQLLRRNGAILESRHRVQLTPPFGGKGGDIGAEEDGASAAAADHRQTEARRPAAERPARKPAAERPAPSAAADAGGQRGMVLNAIAWAERSGILAVRELVAVIVGMQPDSPVLRMQLRKLETAGLVTTAADGAVLQLTDKGQSHATVPDRPLDHAALVEAALGRMPKQSGAMLRELVRVHPKRVDLPTLAKRLGMDPDSPVVRMNAGRLHKLGLATDPKAPPIAASDVLFP
jgi:hypothetical protein